MFLMMLMMGFAVSMNAQASSQGEEAKREEIRQKIGIDYSMPDFNTSKINGNIIGVRLANMLQKLEAGANDYVLGGSIASICCEQNEKLQYANLDKFSVKNISKAGDVITVKANVKLKKNSAGIKNTDIVMVFDKDVSGSQVVNDLFTNLSRYTIE